MSNVSSCQLRSYSVLSFYFFHILSSFRIRWYRLYFPLLGWQLLLVNYGGVVSLETSNICHTSNMCHMSKVLNMYHMSNMCHMSKVSNICHISKVTYYNLFNKNEIIKVIACAANLNLKSIEEWHPFNSLFILLLSSIKRYFLIFVRRLMIAILYIYARGYLG